MEQPNTEKKETSANCAPAKKRKTAWIALAVTMLVVFPLDAIGQSVQRVVTDLSVIIDGGVLGKSVFPMANSIDLRMPKSPVRSRLHVKPKTIVRTLPTIKSQKKTRLTANKNKITTITKSPIQPIATPGPKPKVQVQAVPKQETVTLANIKTNPPPQPQIVKEIPLAQTPKTKSFVPTKPNIAPKETQTAVIDKKVPLRPGRALSVIFNGFATELPELAKSKLSQITNAMRETREYRVQLMAYAGGEGLLTSKLRRISLSRALAVRSFLIEKGVRSTQIDVRALGNKTSEKPVNRVDINLEHR
ncbi:MAG: hypothetical protein CMF69_12640 [Magnetovibrio sp.]|nr:hypothetical protein [Magnetovibrio sp.]